MTMKPRTSLPALVAERSSLLARLVEIDAALLDHHGIEMAAKVRQARPQRAAILAALADGPLDAGAISGRTGQGVHAVQQMICNLVAQGSVYRVSRGIYGLSKKARK